MSYKSLADCVTDLERNGHLIRVDEPVSPHLEIAAILRRIYQAQGPAVLFTKVEGTRFPVLGNLFGTMDRSRFIFRHTLNRARLLIDLKAHPEEVLKNPTRLFSLPAAALSLLPRKVRSGPVVKNEISISDIPAVVSWPQDGGPFVTLPQVYTENVDQPGWRHSNLGMYRIQLSGNDYLPNKEVGMHYQIHRGIGVHHQLALQKGMDLKVAIFIGGPPAMTLSAVMPLPEDLPELAFAGALGGRRLPLIPHGNGLHLHAAADFCIIGKISNRLKPEGPFGDHLGYYSLKHDFPCVEVEKVYCRDQAIYPVTTVGRPPQEDSSFGKLIHEITGPVIPTVLPGIRSIHAVDEAGVHPLLLAVGSERYTPYDKTNEEPQELLTQANAILGQGQLSLAKYVLILNGADVPHLHADDTESFFAAVLERFEPQRDLHFQTQTTIDTLDYTGGALNKGSKLVIAARGSVKRQLKKELDSGFDLPPGFSNPKIVRPGILAISAPRWTALEKKRHCEELARYFDEKKCVQGFPMIVLVDDSGFTSQSFSNFLWETFTRSSPALDVHGVGETYADKHWGCQNLLIDARHKEYQAPPLLEDAQVIERINRFFKKSGALEKWG